MTGGSVIPRIYNDSLRSVEIPAPSIVDQQRIVTQIEQYEAAIRQAQSVMDGCAARKKAILEKYLNWKYNDFEHNDIWADLSRD